MQELFMAVRATLVVVGFALLIRGEVTDAVQSLWLTMYAAMDAVALCFVIAKNFVEPANARDMIMRDRGGGTAHSALSSSPRAIVPVVSVVDGTEETEDMSIVAEAEAHDVLFEDDRDSRQCRAVASQRVHAIVALLVVFGMVFGLVVLTIVPTRANASFLVYVAAVVVTWISMAAIYCA
jgi:hypothetical protein